SAQTAASGASVGPAEGSGVGSWYLGAADVGSALRGHVGFGSPPARSAWPLARGCRHDRGSGGVAFLRPVVSLLLEPCLRCHAPLGGAVTEPFELGGTERVLRGRPGRVRPARGRCDVPGSAGGLGASGGRGGQRERDLPPPGLLSGGDRC